MFKFIAITTIICGIYSTPLPQEFVPAPDDPTAWPLPDQLPDLNLNLADEALTGNVNIKKREEISDLAKRAAASCTLQAWGGTLSGSTYSVASGCVIPAGQSGSGHSCRAECKSNQVTGVSSTAYKTFSAYYTIRSSAYQVIFQVFGGGCNNPLVQIYSKDGVVGIVYYTACATGQTYKAVAYPALNTQFGVTVIFIIVKVINTFKGLCLQR